MNKGKVLILGQLPKESGGNYTTGIARVVENLYKKSFGNIECFWYFTNVPNKKIKKKCSYTNQYVGYRILLFHMLVNMISHPLRTYKEWCYYKNIAKENPLRFEFYKANFKALIDQVKPDLIHIHGSGISPLYFANKSTSIPILITFHGIMYCEEDPSTWHFKEIYKGLMNMPDYYTVLNNETKKKAVILGMPDDKCIIIPNGVDTSHFYFSSKERERVRNAMQVRQGMKVFITVGAVIDRKGQFDFLEVLNSLNIDYQYWIIGKGPDEPRILEYVRLHQLENKVKLLGYVDSNEIYKYHSAADFYSHVSTTEGQALSEIEAFATGLRVIVRKEISGTVIGDVDNDKENYFVLDFNQSNTDELTNWIRMDCVKRQSRSKYDWQEIANKYADYYRLLIAK